MKSEHQGKLIGHHADHLIANLVDNQNFLKTSDHYIRGYGILRRPDKKENTSADGNNPLQQTDHKVGLLLWIN